MKTIKLKVGEIYQKQGTLDMRTIKEPHADFKYPHLSRVRYFDLGGKSYELRYPDFVYWVEHYNVKLIGHYDFKTGKVRVVK